MDIEGTWEGYMPLLPFHAVQGEGDPVLKMSYRVEEMTITV